MSFVHTTRLKSSCEGGMVVVAIRRWDDTVVHKPPNQQTIQAGDTLYVASDHSTRISFSVVTQQERPEMIYGGSRTK